MTDPRPSNVRKSRPHRPKRKGPHPNAPASAPPAAARDSRPVPVLASVAVGAAFAALDLVLAPPVTGPKDAAELTLALVYGGAAHPTGYPLYVMLGHLFVIAAHVLGVSWAYAANAWSAVGGGVAIGLLHALAARIVPLRLAAGRLARFALALLAAGVFALSPVWLLDAILAEVYTWHLAWVAGAGLFALAAMRALADPQRVRETTPARFRVHALRWGFLGGLGLAHHLTSVLVFLPLSVGLVVAVVRVRRWSLALVAAAAAGALLPLASYGFLAWRAFHPAPAQWELLEPSWASVIAHVRGTAYGDLLGRFAPDEVQSGLLRAYCWPVLFPALALAALAVFRARGAERLARACFLAAALLQTLYAFDYGVRDPSCYFEPAMALALLGVPALGAELLGRRAAAPRAGAALTGATLALLVALAAAWLPFAASVRAGAVEVDRRMRTLWAAIPPGPAFVLWDHDMSATFAIYQNLEKSRPEIFAGSPATLSWAGPRRAFQRRWGFDPLAGLEPLTAEKALLIPANLARQTPHPVLVFDLEQRRLVPVPPLGAGGAHPL